MPSERLKKLMGLLNTPMNQGGGLLGNIPQGALLGAAMYGQGIQGKDPLAGLFPAYMQTAQLQKLMTPNKKKPMAVKNKNTGDILFVDPKEVTKDSPYIPIPQNEATAAMRNFEALKNIEKNGTALEKKVGRMVYGKHGRDPMSKTEFLSKVTTNLSKDALADPEEIQKILPKWEKVYDDIFSIKQTKTNGTEEVLTTISIEAPKEFKGTKDQWNKLKKSNPNTTEKDLIIWFNKKYGG